VFLKSIKNLVILFLIVLPISLVGLSLFVDKGKIIETLNTKIEEQFGKKIKYDQDLKISFFPIPQIKLTNIEYYDDTYNLDLKIAELKLVTSWSSILSLNPQITKLNLIEPKLNVIKRKKANKKYTLVKSDYVNSSKFQKIINKFQKIQIERGTLKFLFDENFHEISKIDANLKIGKSYELLSTFYYPNLKSSYNMNILGLFETGFNFQIDQKFLNKNSIIYKGNIDFNNFIEVTGKINSDKLSLKELTTLISKVNFFNKSNYLTVKKNSNPIRASFDAKIENINFQQYIFSKNSFRLNYSNNILKISDASSFFDKAELNLDGTYNFFQKKFSSKFALSDFKVDKKFFSADTPIFIKEAYLNCSANISFNNSLASPFLNKLSFERGRCRTKQPKLGGIDINDVITKVDNMNTFQDFFDLFDFKKFSGDTTLNFMSLDFRVKNKNFLIDLFEANHKFLKVKSNGNMNIASQDLDIDNEVNIVTDKLKNLPKFKVFVKGNIENYKVSYDLEKVKSALFKKGVDKLIGKNKIIINPDSLKNLLNDKGVKELNTDKLFDLFLD